MITFGDRIEVIPIPTQDDLSAEINLEIGDSVDHVVFVVSGTSRFSRQKAAYRIQIR
jgi:hypothetical protein